MKKNESLYFSTLKDKIREGVISSYKYLYRQW